MKSIALTSLKSTQSLKKGSTITNDYKQLLHTDEDSQQATKRPHDPEEYKRVFVQLSDAMEEYAVGS